jgi:hypothetical protein
MISGTISCMEEDKPTSGFFNFFNSQKNIKNIGRDKRFLKGV